MLLREDQITKMSKEDFQKLTPDNQELVLKILAEYKDTGTSKTLKELWEVDYTEIPVSIDEFIENPYYLGNSTRNGASIYPYWRQTYRKIFDPQYNYEEIVFTGAIGVGKTKTADVCLAYLLYKLMCLRDPQSYFKMNAGEEISIFFLNINLTLAEGVGFNTLHKFLINSPWFMKNGVITGRVKERYNPPHHITIKYGSQPEHALGQQVYACLLDEADFGKGNINGDALNAKSRVMSVYNSVKERMNSRFIKCGVQYGRLYLVSSKRSDQDFIEAYIKKMKDEKQDKHMLIIDEPQWVIKPPGTFSKETFPVAVGNKSLSSRILPENTTNEEREAIIKQGYRIIDVPVNLKQSFILDVNTALMNLAGISVIGATAFFNYDMFSKCYIKDYKNPFVTDILTIGMKDDLQIEDFFELDKIPMAVRAMPQFIHIDASLTGDKTGISDVAASGLKEIQVYNGADESIVTEMMYKHIFTVAIQAPHGTEISFEKTRRFIYYLRSNGFNIVGVSLDGFQSADTKQTLITQGYDASIISLDKSPQGYLALRSAMNDGRIGLIQIDLLETELIQLQRDVQTGKLDHPADGCFVANTPIKVYDIISNTEKDIPIIYLYNIIGNRSNERTYVKTITDSGEIELNRIKKVFITKIVNTIIEITFSDGSIIECTDNHPYMIENGSFIQAIDLTAGTRLKTIDNRELYIDSIRTIKLNYDIPVFDIEVENVHNFPLYNGAIVHNSKDCSDSLAGALFNATLHKDSLVDNLQLWNVAFDVNTEISPEQQFISDMQESMMKSGASSKAVNQSSLLAANKLNELMSSFGGDGIIAW